MNTNYDAGNDRLVITLDGLEIDDLYTALTQAKAPLVAMGDRLVMSGQVSPSGAFFSAVEVVDALLEQLEPIADDENR